MIIIIYLITSFFIFVFFHIFFSFTISSFNIMQHLSIIHRRGIYISNIACFPILSMYCFASYCSFNEINTVYTKVYSADIYILLKRSLESFARISLYKTSADSEGVDRPRYNFSENIPCMTISYFCEEQLVLNHTTLTVQKPPF